MRWKAILELNSWQDIAREFLWKTGPGKSEAIIPTWPLDCDKLSDSSIEWPKEYEWLTSRKWVDHIKIGLGRFLPVKVKDIPQTEKGLVQIKLIYKGNQYDIAIDYSDYNSCNISVAKRSFLYFKMQFRKEGYSNKNVIPGGFIPNNLSLYSYLPYLRSAQEKQNLRFDVTGRFSLDFAKETRQKAIDMLNKQKEFEFLGGLKPMRYSRFLREVCRSSICIDLPGNGDFCFRLIDYLAVGSCIIGPKHANILHVPLEDRKHIVFTKNDLSDLVELCKYYLEHDEERKELCHNSRIFFDRYLHREQLASYYLDCCYQKINTSAFD